MAIVINGSGTVTGLAVGGLPDGTVDSGTIATNSVDSAELIDGAIDASHLASGVGGKVLQVVQNTTATSTSVSNSTTLTVATGLTVAITPSLSSSKILVMMNCGGMSSGVTNSILISMFRGSTAIVERNRQGYNSGTGTNAWTSVPFVMSYLDSPSTTSEITYSFKVGTGAGSGTSLQINPGGGTVPGIVIAMEIAG